MVPHRVELPAHAHSKPCSRPHIYTAPLQRKRSARLNKQLLRGSSQLQLDDGAGRKWSKNYCGRLRLITPPTACSRSCRLFSTAGQHCAPSTSSSFVKTLELDMTGRELAMTDCWVNIMPQQVAHSMHLHPLSTISGTHYVQTPKGCAGLQFEDPRLEKFMAARRGGPMRARRIVRDRWCPPKQGKVVLFESWLRHEVPAEPSGRRAHQHQLQLQLVSRTAGSIQRCRQFPQRGTRTARRSSLRRRLKQPASRFPSAHRRRRTPGQTGFHDVRRGLSGQRVAVSSSLFKSAPVRTKPSSSRFTQSLSQSCSARRRHEKHVSDRPPFCARPRVRPSTSHAPARTRLPGYDDLRASVQSDIKRFFRMRRIK